jgi:diguanylate cyclase (GGDEF)-like protein
MPDGATPQPGAEADGGAAEATTAQSPPTRPAGAPESTPPGPAAPEPGPGHRAGRSGVWTGAALLLVVAGAVASFLGARALASENATDARHAFARSSVQIDSDLALAIEHEEDLAVAAGTLLASDPTATAPRFAAWVHWARTLHSYPELDRLGFVSLVRASELAAFDARTTAHASTSSQAAAAGAKPVGAAPAGARPFHCLASVELARSGVRATPSRTDRCALAPALLASRDTTHAVYAASGSASKPALEVETPVYRGNQPPAGFDARRAAFAGWVRAVWAPGPLLAQALAGHAQYAAKLSRGRDMSIASLAGTPQLGAQRTTSSPRAGWTLITFGPPTPSSSVLSDAGALALLIGGLLVSLLAGMLVLLLGSDRAPRPAPKGHDPAHEDLYDPLTGLPNRALLIDRAERMLARAGRLSDSLVGALYIDIDWFKDINEKLGRSAGDELLGIVAERLERVVRTHDTVGRLEGDKFVVLVESAARSMHLDSLARRVMEVLHEPIELAGFGPSFSLTVSIGVAFGRYATPDELLSDAERAMRSAEAAGRDRYTLFNANMRSVIEGRGVMELELNTALQERQLFLLYQPVFDLASRRVAALEALVCWRHPTRGVLGGEDFLPLAEETGLIVPLGRWVLEEACSRAAAWNVAGRPGRVFVDVSANQLSRDGFITDVRRALQQSGLNPALLTLQVSEATVRRDVSGSAAQLEQLKRLGVHIALDDLDGEYAHHAELQHLALDFLKVDRRSLGAAADEEYGNWLLEGIVIVGQDRSLPVIATGVETPEQLASLHAAGCAMAEGLFMGRPSPAEHAESLFDLPFPPAATAARQAAP